MGRLDKPTSGLLLATNDGALATAVCAPGLVAKEYLACVRGVPTGAQLAQLLAGVELGDGVARAVAVEVDW